MVNKNYDLVLSDLGNVLINFDHRIAVRKILSYTPKKEEEVYQLLFDSGLTKLFEEGKITPLDFFKRLKDRLLLDMEYKEFFSIWNDIFFETLLNKKIQDFLKGIKGKYRLAMISNINEMHYMFLKNKMPVFGEFDKIILSYEVGFRKPAPEIYHAALDSVKVDASKTFYIDDRADLVEAAQGLGINGITFNGEESFYNIVKELSL